ncbi:EthD domain-containing protein [Pseudomonas kurunegalensis]|uniref:EthD domain-containing protein n=1 Tax=Pseudomonas kurunegalensis TaxID=485880 RepID=UPI002570C877|nr:EthD domain-containing protein [Pseudomonas kurunegalensis]WJD60697.1 EthD domain-containing protein [Pseudomonas kurunegalensis]
MRSHENEAQITLVITLQHREGVSKEDFYSYWSNVHAPVMARIPDVWSYVLHHVETARIPFWPLPKGIEQVAPVEYQVEGFAELSYLNDEAAERAFVVSDAPGGYTHDDAQVALWAGLFYTNREASRTLRDDLDEHDQGHSYILAFQFKDDADRERATAWVTDQANRAVGIDSFARVRLHTFPEYDHEMDEGPLPPNMRHTAVRGEALDAVIEIVARSPIELSRGFSQWTVGEEALDHIRSLHAYRRHRRYIMRAGGVITEHGIRTPYVTDLIASFGAISQLRPGMRELMLNGTPPDKK